MREQWLPELATFEAMYTDDTEQDGVDDLAVGRDFFRGAPNTGLDAVRTPRCAAGDENCATATRGLFGRRALTGDFNRDGSLDFVTSDGTYEEKSVLISLGSPAGFLESVTLVESESVQGIQLFDYNGDDLPDLILRIDDDAHCDAPCSSLFYYAGSRDGTFVRQRAQRLEYEYDDLELADLDGDGFEDMIGSRKDGAASDGPYIAYGDKNGWTESGIYPLDSAVHSDGSLQLVDVNQDGRSDVLIDGWIYLAGADRTFTLAGGDSLGDFLGTYADDANHDGKLELIGVSYSFGPGESDSDDRYWVKIGRANGASDIKQTASVCLPSTPVDLTAGDYDDDGKIDVAMNLEDQVYVVYGVE
ncbi:MAG: FG-GAP-like repeat-containing protein [Myxococcales bacterium]